MKTSTHSSLEHQIERLVRAHLETQRQLAARAVERAFTAAVARRKREPTERGGNGRRTPSQMASVAERLYGAVRANPGQTMMVLSAELGEPRSVLARPMLALKRAGRVRSAGQRHLTRYFPMGK